MAVKLRLKRMGAKKRPFYRITYNPIMEPAEIKINSEVALKWLNQGAIPTDTVRDLLSKQGIMKAYHESKSTKEGK